MNRQTLTSTSYQLFMLVLCVYALVALLIQSAVNLDSRITGVLEIADVGVCVIFFVDFLASLWRAENRVRYLATWGWLDLISSIPMLDLARWGRIARVLRILRVLRSLRAAKTLSTVVLQHRAENSFLAASLAAMLLIVFSSVAILQFEATEESNIKTAEDAVWWSITTITTVGYGDRYPVTSEGRFVAAALMCAGVGLVSVFSGFLAAWFLAPKAKVEQSEINALRAEIATLQQSIERLREEAQSP